MSIFAEIGRNIVVLRRQKGLSQERLALNADMSVSYLRSIEHGTANPTLDALCRIADALDEPFMSVVSVEDSRGPMAVEALLRRGADLFPVCPRCGRTLEREYQACCDRCGQRLDWRALSRAAVRTVPRAKPPPEP